MEASACRASNSAIDSSCASTASDQCFKTIAVNISLRDHVPNVDISNRCNTSSVESQLRSKRLRWLGHSFRMPNDRVPKLLFGRVKGSRPSGRPRLSFNDVASSDCHECCITRPYKDAQTQTALARQLLSCTYLAHHELESVLSIIIITIIIIVIAVNRMSAKH